MNGKDLVGRLKRLSDVEKPKDIRQLTHALFPGAHCPLFGAMLAIRGIKDAYMLLVGTEECSYYTKSATMGNASFGGVDSRCLSIIVDKHDVTFGAWEKIEKDFAQVVKEFSPKAVFLVGTCLLEIIGDDIDALARSLSQTHGIPVAAVHTEHFKTENHLPGVAAVITACKDMMKKRGDGEPRGEYVNVLGQRMGDFGKTELHGALVEAGVAIGMTLPSGCTVAEIEAGSAAKVNVVVDATGLPLAKAMEREWGVPYVVFERFTDPDNIHLAYTALFDHLKLPLPARLAEARKRGQETFEKGAKALSGIRYIYGNTPLPCFEFNAFMVRLGMIPQLIQTVDLPEPGNVHLKRVLEINPYVVKTANITPLRYVYDELRPHLYLGHEFAMTLRKKGIEIVRSDHIASMLGYEVTEAIVTELTRAAGEARKMEQERSEHESV